MKLNNLKAICHNFIKFEGAMDLVMPASRRGNENAYCKSNRQNDCFRSLSNCDAKQKIFQCASTHEVLFACGWPPRGLAGKIPTPCSRHPPP